MPEAESVAPENLHASKAAALEYLRLWKTAREAWRFKKVRQTFLLQHAFDPVQLPKEDFDSFIEYISGLEGSAKDVTVKKAQAMLELEGKAPQAEPEIVKTISHLSFFMFEPSIRGFFWCRLL